ncbi:2-keto-4-pentenoate hydratase [Streptomyces sp. NPDC096012]|uniref:2-keto-4-pentenoate hydratase n=1 Tax=Streptomyces sp. NPDC096012 TaxID=3155684 RepID=UPI003369E211
MDAVERAEAARRLREAYDSRIPIEPLSEKYGDLTPADAYEIQQIQIRERLAQGRTVLGHKVGLTSAAMQRQLGVDRPDYGVLLDDMCFGEHQPVDTARFLQPRVEPEVAFVLKRELRGPGVTAAQAAAAVDFVLPALEIIDSRIADWRITFTDTVGDNASSGGLVLGGRPMPLSVVDLRLMGCLLHRNGALVGSGAGGAVLETPLASLVWLANTLGAFGVSLEEGHVVLPGSITAAVPVRAGDCVTASFAGLGTVTVRFAQDGGEEVSGERV